jgi:hypothetical protein
MLQPPITLPGPIRILLVSCESLRRVGIDGRHFAINPCQASLRHKEFSAISNPNNIEEAREIEPYPQLGILAGLVAKAGK